MKPPITPRVPRELAAAGYGAASLLLILPLTDTLAALLPHDPGSMAWRFAAFGLVSRALVSPVLALFLLLVLAAVFGHDRPRRLVGILGFSFVLVVAAGLPLFILDALQIRAGVVADARRAFDITVAIALAKYLSALLATLVIARAARSPALRQPQDAPAPAPRRELLGAYRGRSSPAPAPVASSRPDPQDLRSPQPT